MCRAELFPLNEGADALASSEDDLVTYDERLTELIERLILVVGPYLAGTGFSAERIEIIQRTVAALRRGIRVPPGTTPDGENIVSVMAETSAVYLYRTLKVLSSSSRNNDDSHVRKWLTLSRQIEAKRSSVRPLIGGTGMEALWHREGLDMLTLRSPRMNSRVARFLLQLAEVEVTNMAELLE